MTRATKPPTRDATLNAALSAMNVEYLQCRDWGHAWRPYRAAYDGKERAYRSELRCGRCKTLRTRWIGRDGALLGSHYDYSDGYRVEGLGFLSGTDRNVLRLKSLEYVLPTDTTEDEES